MQEYDWSNTIEKAKAYISEERISEAENCFLQAEGQCSDDPEERFALCLNLALFYEYVVEDLVKTERYKEKALKYLKVFRGYGNSEVYGHMIGLADLKRKLGKTEQAAELEKEAEELKYPNSE
ncbi:hypothetical protein A9Q99_23700 [Gammaproteobacteria bacterium 45_16_T64]|nr:hypothetical protein A9Q99_23700 [Gammaproteobacteria bacterium 45_16_T64]